VAAASSSIAEPLYTAREMRALDEWAIAERGIPSLELMEKAGAGVAAAVTDFEPAGPVRIVCGKGNNGGDGLVAARRLGELGMDAEALLLGSAVELSGDALANHQRLLSAGGTAREIGGGELPVLLAGSALAVDALLGTGFAGTPRSPIDQAIEAINELRCPVVAVDVPSGADASTGVVAGACVRADVTVTFHTSKLGLWIMPAKAFAGRVEVVDIGIPVDDPLPPDLPSAGLILPGILGLLPRRSGDATKFSSGSVLVVGGSTGLTGAACLACEAAMRAGAGWVRAGVPGSLNLVFEQKLTEVMTIPLTDRGGALEAGNVDAVLEAAQRADSVVLGPGLGRAEGSFELARELVTRLDVPLLIDADGLNALAGRLEIVAERTAPTVLTPHAGELARLLEKQSSEVAAQRLANAREAADRSQAIVILKGDDSLVVEPDGRLGVSPGGSPGLATAGTGDVLSGVIGAFLAKGLGAFEASCAGVYAHAQAGWVAATDLGADSVIASDVIGALPAALQRPAENEVEGPSA
jgi:ADP-dependent NAD(P)H-hydrate dehydratase / NAD(P)H-hydrate epimerase